MVEIELLHAREEKRPLEKKLAEEAQNIKRLLSEKSQLKAINKHRLQKQARHSVHSPYVGREYSLTKGTISSKRVLSY